MCRRERVVVLGARKSRPHRAAGRRLSPINRPFSRFALIADETSAPSSYRFPQNLLRRRGRRFRCLWMSFAQAGDLQQSFTGAR